MNSLVTLIAVALCLQTQVDAAARMIRVALQRSTTEQAGQFGQAVMNYHTLIQIGTPPVNFEVQFDLGAQEHFVPHYSWNPLNRNLHYRNGFQCKSSSTCKKDDRKVGVEYQNCQLTGKRYEDFVTLTNVTLVLPNNDTNTASPGGAQRAIHWIQNFLAISSASDGRFSSLPIDGFFGLAPIARSASSLKNILISLQDAKQIENLQFSFWFNPDLSSPNGGELVLGGADTTRYQGQIFWHSLALVNYNMWAVSLQYVKLFEKYISCVDQWIGKCQVHFSSGLNDIYGPPADVQAIYNALGTSRQSSGLQSIDCARIPHLPVLTFSIDGIPYSLLPSNYIRKIVDGVIFKKETCYVAIFPQTNSDATRVWTLGTNFLGAYYSIFDMTHRQIGFAALR